MAISVHLVGGDPWWHQVIGPALIALTAVVAAWIAARTANRRQQQQLSHDRDLQQAQLAYDSDRQEAQLSHDRDLQKAHLAYDSDRQEAQLAHDRDLQKAQLAYDREQQNRRHVRDTIDSAVRNLYEAMKQSAEYQQAIVSGDEKRDEHRRAIEDEALSDLERDGAVRDYEDAMNAVGEATVKGFGVSTELMSQYLRLSLRLGVEHPICKSHWAYLEAYGTSFEILRDLPTLRMADEDHEKVKEAGAAETETVVEFLSSCRTWFEGEQRQVERESSKPAA